MIVNSMSKSDIYRALKKDYERNVNLYISARIIKYKIDIQILTAVENHHVELAWESFVTKDNIKYRFRPEGDRETFAPKVIAEFAWQGRNCLAYFTEGLKGVIVNVFTDHALNRYAERVLKKDVPYKDVFYKYLFPKMSYAFRTVLPSPNSHAYSKYCTIADGLFLGEFNLSEKEDDDWYNTCISLNETGVSQGKILHTLRSIQNNMNILGFDPFDPDEYDEENGSIMKPERLPKTEKGLNALKELSRLIYLLNKLYLLLDFPFYNEYKNKINYDILISKAFLKAFGIDYTKLTPYGKDGIAIRGELEYKG